MLKSIYNGFSKDEAINWGVLVAILFGSAAGAVVVGLCPSVFEDFFFDDNGNFYLNMFLTTSVNSSLLFKNTAKMRMELMMAVAVISYMRPKKFFFIILMFILGLCGGTVISENTLYFIGTGHFAGKYMGILVYVVSVLPQYIAYGTAIFIMYRYCIKKDAPAGRHIAYIAMCSVLVFAGALSEAYLSPILLKWIMKLL